MPIKGPRAEEALLREGGFEVLFGRVSELENSGERECVCKR